MGPGCTTYRIFVSHGASDTYIVEKFLKPRIADTGASVFVDAGKIQYGDDFRVEILRELAACDELLALFTTSSVRRPWIFAEIGATLVRSKRIVALTYGPSESDLQQLGILSLLGTNALLEFEDFDTYLSQLSDRVKGVANG